MPLVCATHHKKNVQLPTLNDMADLDNEGVDLERERVPRRKSPDFMCSDYGYIYIYITLYNPINNVFFYHGKWD